MKRSKLGAISAVVGIILGIMIILVGVNFVVGKVDVAKYGNELKELIQNNEYGQKALALGDKVWKKVPQKYEGYALGGLAGLAGLYLVVAGILCLRKEAKKSFIVFASIETVVLGALFALTFNTYMLVVAVLYALVFPVPKYIGRGNFKAREEEYKDRKTVTSPFEKLIGSYKSKKTKKGKAVKKDKKEKVLSKPISTVGARTEEKVEDKQKKTKKQKTKKQKKVQKIK